MSEPIPVTLRYEYTWRSGRLAWELCNILNALSVPDFRTIREGAVEKLGWTQPPAASRRTLWSSRRKVASRMRARSTRRCQWNW